MKSLGNKNVGLKSIINTLTFVAVLLLVPVFSQAGQFADSVIEAIDKVPTVSFCNNANPDRIRLVRKSWTCVLNKAKLVNSAASMISLARSYEKLNNENTSKGRYIMDRLNHHYDRVRESDYQLRRNRCTRACF